MNNPLFSRGHATLKLVIGGACQPIATAPQLGVDIVGYFDCGNEIAGRDIHPGAFGMSLAWGTGGELLEKLRTVPALVRAALLSTPAATDPMTRAGQCSLGGPSLERCLGDGRLAEVFYQMFEHLLILHGGDIESIDIIVVASSAGCTGGGMACKIAEVVEQVFVTRISVQVTITLFRVNPLTFVDGGLKRRQSTLFPHMNPEISTRAGP